MTNKNQKDAIRAFMAKHDVNYTTARRLLAEQREASADGVPPTWQWRHHAPSPTLHRLLVEEKLKVGDYDRWRGRLERRARAATRSGDQHLVNQWEWEHTERPWRPSDLTEFPILRGPQQHLTRPGYDYFEYAADSEIEGRGPLATMFGTERDWTPDDVIEAEVSRDDELSEHEAAVEYLKRNPTTLVTAITVAYDRWNLYLDDVWGRGFEQAWEIFEQALATFNALAPKIDKPWYVDYQRIGNRAPLRCLYWAMVCRWHADAFEEAEPLAEDLVWLVPNDRLRVRFDLDRIRAREPWEDSPDDWLP